MPRQSKTITLWQIVNDDLASLQSDLRQAETITAKAKVFAGICIKALVTLIFCILFVVAFMGVLGKENAIVGVVVLLSVLTFQKVDFGYSSAQGAAALFGIFILFAFVPPLAAVIGGITAALIMMLALLVLLIVACDRVEYQNHIVLVLSFLLLYGYPVTTIEGYKARVAGLLIGGVWAASILYRKNRHKQSTRSLLDVIKDFDPRKKDAEWKLKLAVLVPAAMLCGELLGLERPMWIGIAAMSVLSPFEHLRPLKMFERLLGSLLGAVLFYGLTLIPGVTPTLVGLSGGFLVGLTTSYKYQTIFNSLGALSVAMLLMGPHESILARIQDNAFAIIFVIVAVFVLDMVTDYLQKHFSTAEPESIR